MFSAPDGPDLVRFRRSLFPTGDRAREKKRPCRLSDTPNLRIAVALAATSAKVAF
jgi:hypothetical protein